MYIPLQSWSPPGHRSYRPSGCSRWRRWCVPHLFAILMQAMKNLTARVQNNLTPATHRNRWGLGCCHPERAQWKYGCQRTFLDLDRQQYTFLDIGSRFNSIFGGKAWSRSGFPSLTSGQVESWKKVKSVTKSSYTTTLHSVPCDDCPGHGPSQWYAGSVALTNWNFLMCQKKNWIINQIREQCRRRFKFEHSLQFVKQLTSIAGWRSNFYAKLLQRASSLS